MRAVLFLAVVALAALPSCGSSLAAFGELCASNDDCTGDLVCAGTRTGSVCADRCEVDADCASHGAMAYCAVGSLACLQACQDDRDCAGDTVCMEGFCEAGMAPE